MGRELLSSKVVIVEEEPRVRGIATGPTAVTGFVGIAERGPIGIATLCTSPDEFEETFGGFTRDSEVALAVAGFFENGGTRLWVVRTCRYADPADPTTAAARPSSATLYAPGAPRAASVESALEAPYALADGDRLVLAVPTGEVRLEIDAGRARIESDAGPFALADGADLELVVDGQRQTAVLRAGDFVDITAATADEVARALNLAIEEARAGTAGGRVFVETDAAGRAVAIEVRGGSAAAALGFPTGAISGTGNVLREGAVGADEIVVLLAALGPALQPTESADHRLVLATTATGDAARFEVRAGTSPAFGLELGEHRGEDAAPARVASIEARDAGAFGDRLRVEVRAASSGRANVFDLAVLEGTRVREILRDLSLVETAERFVERIVNDERSGSRWVRLALARPITITALAPQSARLSGGDDGLTDLSDADFVGSQAGGTGLFALDRVLDLSILAVPGRATATVHGAMLRYCEVDRDGLVFAVLDPPAGLRATEIVDYVERDAALEGLTEVGAIYWPRVRIANPSRAVFGSSVAVIAPPSGIIAGVYGRTDAARPGGIYDAPAGIELGRMFGVLAFETDEVLDERKRDLVFPHRINPLTTAPGLPRYIDGARVLKGNGNFPFVSSRRGVSFIERALKRSLEWVRHRNPTDSLLSRVDGSVRAFLLEQTGLDAFASRDPDKAFFLEVSQRLVSVPGGTASRVLARVGLAMNVPSEFVVISVSQDTRAIEAELGG